MEGATASEQVVQAALSAAASCVVGTILIVLVGRWVRPVYLAGGLLIVSVPMPLIVVGPDRIEPLPLLAQPGVALMTLLPAWFVLVGRRVRLADRPRYRTLGLAAAGAGFGLALLFLLESYVVYAVVGACLSSYYGLALAVFLGSLGFVPDRWSAGEGGGPVPSKGEPGRVRPAGDDPRQTAFAGPPFQDVPPVTPRPSAAPRSGRRAPSASGRSAG